MPTPVQATRLQIEVVCATGGVGFQKTILVPTGQTLGWAVNASGVYSLYPALRGAALGIWGQVYPPETVLNDGDRAEIYHPVDPAAVAASRRRDQT